MRTRKEIIMICGKVYYQMIYLILIIGVIIAGCSKKASEPGENNGNPEINDMLVDTLATIETVALFKNLKTIAATKVLFGHQDDLAYGIGWVAEPGRSDVKEVCGDYPAVYGWDLGDIQNPANLDGVNFNQMRGWIKEVFNRGGINTISMHLDNPVTNNDAWDNTPAVAAILPGGNRHESYLHTLELIANFLKSLKTDENTYIPIILRLYHEHNHSWAWWGANSCTVEDYNALWHMTVEYFRDTQKIHHLLYAISPQEINSEAEYLERYPGDEYVDVLGMDYYLLWNLSDVPRLGSALRVIAVMAEQRGKISALTEVGIDQNPYANWWTDYLLASIKQNSDSQKIAWALVWRNARTDHFFGPYPGHISAGNFVKFYNDPLTAFESDLPEMYE